MPAKRKRKPVRRRASPPVPEYVLMAIIYDPENRFTNIRFVTEGPFKSSADAIVVLKSLLQNGRYSCASTQVLTLSGSRKYYETMDAVRAMMKK